MTCSSCTRALTEDLGRDARAGSGRAGSWLRGTESGPATGLEPPGLGFFNPQKICFIVFGDRGREREEEAGREREKRQLAASRMHLGQESNPNVGMCPDEIDPVTFRCTR